MVMEAYKHMRANKSMEPRLSMRVAIGNVEARLWVRRARMTVEPKTITRRMSEGVYG